MKKLLIFLVIFFAAEEENPLQFDPSWWKIKLEPVANTTEFSGQARIQHSLSSDSATPYDYFCLFIPVTFYSKWVNFTNLKANLVSEMKDGNALLEANERSRNKSIFCFSYLVFFAVQSNLFTAFEKGG